MKTSRILTKGRADAEKEPFNLFVTPVAGVALVGSSRHHPLPVAVYPSQGGGAHEIPNDPMTRMPGSVTFAAHYAKEHDVGV